LVAELCASAAVVRQAAQGPVDALAFAVHDQRKALRRARAVLTLLGDALPKQVRRAALRSLRQARRSLGSARDHAAAPEVLAGLDLTTSERRAVPEVLAAAARAAPRAARVRRLLQDCAARTASVVAVLEAGLPPWLPWSIVAAGVQGSYAAARRACARARSSRRAFHRWRRRCKELTIQLALLCAGPWTTALLGELNAATVAQGTAVDLILVRGYVREYGRGLAPAVLIPLLSAIKGRLDASLRDAWQEGRAAFQRCPRRFLRGLAGDLGRDLQGTRWG
jgi:hypothetical protein